MSDPDYSGIDPLRVPEARRRIAAVSEYLALPSPNTADAIRLAATIGLSRWQFQRLAAAWRDHRDPKLLVFGKRGTSSRDYGIERKAADIARHIIDREVRSGKSATSIAILIEDECGRQNVSPPSRPTIWNWLRAARAKGGFEMAGPPRIVVGRLWFHLPVAGQPADNMPTLLAAVLLPERTIVAFQISITAGEPPSLKKVLDDLLRLRTSGACRRVLLLDGADRLAAKEMLHDANIRVAKDARPSVKAQLSSAFSGKLGPLTVIHRRAAARPAKTPKRRLEQAIAGSQVVAAIEAAVHAHNAGVDTEPMFDIESEAIRAAPATVCR